MEIPVLELLFCAIALFVGYLLSIKVRILAVVLFIGGAGLYGYYRNDSDWITALFAALFFMSVALVAYMLFDFAKSREKKHR